MAYWFHFALADCVRLSLSHTRLKEHGEGLSCGEKPFLGSQAASVSRHQMSR